MAFACRPSVIVLDEPTTGLDVSTQAHVLATVRDLCRAARRRRAVRHPRPGGGRQPRRPCGRDVRRAHRRGGRDRGQSSHAAAHPYTRHLIARVPRHQRRPEASSASRAAPVARAATGGLCVRASLRARHRRVPRRVPAGDRDRAGHTVRCVRPAEIRRPHAPSRARADAPSASRRTRCCRCATSARRYGAGTSCTTSSFDVERGECVALVGESGSGKSTLPRSIGGLHREWTGEIAARRRALATRRATDATPSALAHPVRLPEPVQLAQPAAHGRRVGRPAAAHRSALGGERGAARGSARCSSGCR